jgi:hypothetical protein
LRRWGFAAAGIALIGAAFALAACGPVAFFGMLLIAVAPNTFLFGLFLVLGSVVPWRPAIVWVPVGLRRRCCAAFVPACHPQEKALPGQGAGSARSVSLELTASRQYYRLVASVVQGTRVLVHRSSASFTYCATGWFYLSTGVQEKEEDSRTRRVRLPTEPCSPFELFSHMACTSRI